MSSVDLKAICTNIFLTMDKLVIKRTKTSAAKSPEKKMCDKNNLNVSVCVSVSKEQAPPLQVTKSPTKQKQSARKQFIVGQTNTYLNSSDWSRKATRNCIVKLVFSLELYIKLKTSSFRGAGLGMIKASKNSISQATSRMRNTRNVWNLLKS